MYIGDTTNASARVVANGLDGLVIIQPTARQLADMLGVSTTYVAVASQLSPAKRQAIIDGRDTTSFVSLLDPPAAVSVLPVPAPTPIKQLFDLVRAVGIEPALDVVARGRGGGIAHSKQEGVAGRSNRPAASSKRNRRRRWREWN